MIMDPSKFPSRSRNIIPRSVAVVVPVVRSSLLETSAVCVTAQQNMNGKLEKQDGQTERHFSLNNVRG